MRGEANPPHLEHFGDDDLAETAPVEFPLAAHAASEPPEDQPDTDVELADGHEIDGLSDPD